jgi:2,4-diketo-3-deoxy-L-fuconate hydrolase
MRLYTFQSNDDEKIGAEQNGKLVDLSGIAPDMLTLIRGGEAMLDAARGVLSGGHAPTYEFSQVKLCAPIPRPGKMMCSGINYKSHGAENPNAVYPNEPDVFSKVSTAVVGPGDPIVLPPMSKEVDYEVEFAAVIGKKMSYTPQDRVMDHIFGYTIVHDVSARDVQFLPGGRTRGKNFDSFAPMGPCIVTKDELTDPGHCQIRAYLNGELMQDGNTKDWIFSLPVFLNYLSSIMTMDPGDVLTTGTCAGIGYFRDPKIFLKPGDVCVLEIEHIGKLENPVVAYQG